MNVMPQAREMQHISAMCCYSAAGDKVPILFIFPQRQSDFPEISEIFGIYYSTSTNGWMTANLFAIWCIIFVAHIQQHRANRFLDPTKEVYLFIDGHPSRFSPFGMRFLHLFNIRCFIFPAHCTHVLQPFDVGVASPLKTHYEAKFIKFVVKFRELNRREPNAAELRKLRVDAFIAAWTSLSSDLLEKSFHSAGIFPFNKEATLTEILNFSTQAILIFSGAPGMPTKVKYFPDVPRLLFKASM